MHQAPQDGARDHIKTQRVWYQEWRRKYSLFLGFATLGCLSRLSLCCCYGAQEVNGLERVVMKQQYPDHTESV